MMRLLVLVLTLVVIIGSNSQAVAQKAKSKSKISKQAKKPVVKEPVEEDPVVDADYWEDHEAELLTPISSLLIYPEVARRAGLEGKVWAAFLIEKDGTVGKIEIEKSDYDVFKNAVYDLQPKLRFKPAIVSGLPVKTWMSMPIIFKLSDVAADSVRTKK